MKKFINAFIETFLGEVEKQPYFIYQINDENDIASETAKKYLIESINISEIMKKCDADNLDSSQKAFVFESLKSIVSQIEDIE